MTRAEHLAWSKKRALEYVERGELAQAFTSMASDLEKHDELRGHKGIMIGTMLMLSGNLSSERDMRHFIEGFN